jgi:hypothetical protein
MAASQGQPAARPLADHAGPEPSAERHTTLTDLQLELLRRVASYVHRNEVAANLRLTCEAASEHLAEFTAISCREGPVPAHALVWKGSQPEVVQGLTRTERETVAERTLETGCLHAARRLVTGEGGKGILDFGSLGIPPSETWLIAAAGAGQLATVQHLRRHGCAWGSSVASAAAGKGRTEMCLWLLAEGCPSGAHMLLDASRGVYAGTCEQLLAAGCRWSERAAGAAGGGHIGVVRHLLQLSKERPVATHEC